MDHEAIGRRAMKAGCGWRAGMKDLQGNRWGSVTLHDGSRWCVRKDGTLEMYAHTSEMNLPDFRDPATLGAVEIGILAPLGVHILCEPGECPECGEEYIVFYQGEEDIQVADLDGIDSRAEAVVLALEAIAAQS